MMFEQLEARRLLTTIANFGDGTTVNQAGDGTLTIQGSGSAFALNVTVVENGTTQSNPGAPVGLGNVVVTDNNTGTDCVAFHVNTKNPITIKGAGLGDTINYDGTTTHANIQGGTGADQISFLDRANGGTVASTNGRGYLLACVFSNHATLNGGGSDDFILVDTCFDPVNGNGLPDGTTVQATNKVVVNAQGGNDTVESWGFVNQNSTNTGSGTISTNVSIVMSDGNDTTYIYSGKATCDGGKGTDVLHKSASAVVSFKNYESVMTDL